MTVQITAMYASLLAIMMMGLSGYVSIMRAKLGVSIGDGGNTALSERIRRHGNFVETVPMALLLMALAEISGAKASWIIAAGAILIVARVLHFFGLSASNVNSILRGLGAFATFVAMFIAIVAIWRSELWM